MITYGHKVADPVNGYNGGALCGGDDDAEIRFAAAARENVAIRIDETARGVAVDHPGQPQR